MIFASSQIFASLAHWPLPAPLVALHYFSLLLLAVSITSFAVFLTLFGAWACFMSPGAFERRVSWWFHRFSRTHRLISNAAKEDLTVEPIHDEVYRDTYWLLRSPFGDYTCYPESALALLLPREFDLERRVLRLDDAAFAEWQTFLRANPSLDEKFARLVELESAAAAGQSAAGDAPAPDAAT